jgi:hypothetical protein
MMHGQKNIKIAATCFGGVFILRELVPLLLMLQCLLQYVSTNIGVRSLKIITAPKHVAAE